MGGEGDDMPGRVISALRRSPGTVAYVGVLVATTVTLHRLSAPAATALLRSQSTNLHNMAIHPLRVLVLSAFWVQSARLLPWLLRLGVVMAPLERWLGTAKAIGVFAAGHVGATLVTVAGVWRVTHGGTTDPSLVNTIDVGMSYGFYAMAGLIVFHLPRRFRLVAAIALVAKLGLAAEAGRTFTDAGHLCALAIGFGCYPLTRGRRTETSTPGAPPRYSASPAVISTRPVSSTTRPCAPVPPRMSNGLAPPRRSTALAKVSATHP